MKLIQAYFGPMGNDDRMSVSVNISRVINHVDTELLQPSLASVANGQLYKQHSLFPTDLNYNSLITDSDY